MISFATAPAGRAARRGAALSALLLLFLVLVTLPFARIALAPEPAFLPIFAAFAFAGELVTAYLLFTQARISGHGPLAVLGAGYLYNAAIIVPHIATFPGVFSVTGLFGGHAQSAVWLWALWHGGFPLWIFAYLAVERSSSVALRRSFAGVRGMSSLTLAALAIAASLAVLATAAVGALPPLVDHGNFTPGFRCGVLTAVVVLNLAALGSALSLRKKSVTQVWLIVAIVSACGDVALTLLSGSRFSLGWYLARCYSLAAATTIFAVFLAEVNVMYARMAALATIDGLTGIGNRRHFDERLAAAFRDAARQRKSLALVIFDVDEFKKYNDACGHPAGDEALRIVAHAAAQSVVRPTDTVARYGGEEFAVVLPDTTAAGATIVAERIRAAVEAAGVPHPTATASRYLTVSMGVADIVPERADTAAALVARADAALYHAKQGGRNRVAVDAATRTVVELSQ